MSVLARIARNVLMGIAWGVALATLYSCYVVFLYFIRGSVVFRDMGLSLSTVIGSYYLGGLLGGGVVGLLAPLGRHPVGAALLGFMAAIPVLTAFGLLHYPPWEWRTKLPEMVVHVGAVLGPLCGLLIWFRRKDFII